MKDTDVAADVILNRPQRVLPYIVRAVLQLSSRWSWWAQRRRYDWLMVDRPSYAYGLRQACSLVSALGGPGFTAIELGVASGTGLVALEQHARHYEERLGVSIAVVGFDTGVGMPKPTDYRDSPFQWFEGAYTMDEPVLRRTLHKADLILGDVAETISSFQPRLPIGFVSFDLDYYASTSCALQLFRGDDFTRWLPRVELYFDDISTIESVGERLAIAEWNENHADRKIGQIFGLRDHIFGAPGWADQLFQAHFFDHQDYAVPVVSLAQQQLPLRQVR